MTAGWVSNCVERRVPGGFGGLLVEEHLAVGIEATGDAVDLQGAFEAHEARGDVGANALGVALARYAVAAPTAADLDDALARLEHDLPDERDVDPVAVDAYVLDSLMPDLVGHDRRAALAHYAHGCACERERGTGRGRD